MEETKLKCLCGKQMKIERQKHFQTSEKIEFRCSCGNKGLMLRYESDGKSDMYIYDKDKKLLKHWSD